MIVTFITDHTCPTCGHHNTSALHANIRITRTGWRGGPAIGTKPHTCRECTAPLAARPDTATIHPADAEQVNDYRARMGWNR